MSQKPELSIVLPTLNEADGLRVLLPRVKDLFERLELRGEILVIDGGSKDETVAVAQAAGARVEFQRGRGFGSAVCEGLAAASADWIALLDADGSHAPEDLARFWARRGEADLIVGSRYCRGGSAEMPLARQVLSRALNTVSRRVLDLPVRESSSGFRLYRASTARALASGATDFSVQQDLLVGILADGGRVVEEPIHYAPRVGGVSKASAWKLAPAYVRLLLRLKPRRGGWRAEWPLAAVVLLGAAVGARAGASAAACLALGAACVHEISRLRRGRAASAAAAAVWALSPLFGVPAATPAATAVAAGAFLLLAAADSFLPPS